MAKPELYWVGPGVLGPFGKEVKIFNPGEKLTDVVPEDTIARLLKKKKVSGVALMAPPAEDGVGELKAKLTELSGRLKTAEDAAASATDERKQANDECDRLKARVAELEKTNGELTSECDRLKATAQLAAALVPATDTPAGPAAAPAAPAAKKG